MTIRAATTGRGIAAALAGAVATAALTVGGTAAIAQDKPENFPNRPITIVVCYGVGSGSDSAVAELIPTAEEAMGVRINKVNRPGGGGLNCMPEFMQAPADGYTLLQNSDPVVSKYVLGQSDIHPTEDIRPLITMSAAPTGFYVRSDDERFHDEEGNPSWDKVVEYAKENPTTLSNIPVEMEQVTAQVALDFFDIHMDQVLFNRAAERFAAVIGGQVDVLMEQPGDVAEFIEAGQLTPVLAVWPERWDFAPDTPATGADYGMEWQPLLRVRSLFVPADTPEDVYRYLEKVFTDAFNSESYQDFMERGRLNIVRSYYSGDETTEMFNKDIDTYKQVLSDLGMDVRQD